MQSTLDNLILSNIMQFFTIVNYVLQQFYQIFEKCVEISPEIGHAKYMYLGQLSQGADAIHYFNKGISIMTKEMEVS